jgi:hypothetical protein
MAYSFTAASSQNISCNSPASLSAVYPITFSAWAYGTLDTVAMTAMGWYQAATNQGFRILFAGQATSDPIRANLLTTVNYISQISPGFTVNTWHHVCAVFTSSTSRQIYRDGTAGTANTVDATPTSLTRLLIGTHAGIEYFNGYISDVGVWSAALGVEEINSLAKGFSAKRIRPQSLEFYVPLIRNLQDYSSSSTLTNNNTAIAIQHNRIYS